MTPTPMEKPPKSPNHDPTSGHSRRHPLHPALESLECLRSPSASEYSPLVPRGGDASLASSYSSTPGGGGRWERKSSSLPIPSDKSSASFHAPPFPEGVDATANGVAAAATTNGTKKGDSECVDDVFALRITHYDRRRKSDAFSPYPFLNDGTSPLLPPIVAAGEKASSITWCTRW
jgi:hypothetical protein